MPGVVIKDSSKKSTDIMQPSSKSNHFFLLPSCLQIIVYEFDPTYRQYYSRLLLDDIEEYIMVHGVYYIPVGIHRFFFYPRFWMVDTNTSIMDPSPKQTIWKVLRFFQNEMQLRQFCMRMLSPNARPRRLHWNRLFSWCKETFLSFS